MDIVGEFGELLVSSDKTALLDAQQQSSDTAATLALTLTERDVAACIERFASALRKGVALTPPPRKTDSGSATALLDADISAGKSLVSQALVTCAAKLASKLPSQVSPDRQAQTDTQIVKQKRDILFRRIDRSISKTFSCVHVPCISAARNVFKDPAGLFL